MPKVNEITITQDQLVSISNRMYKLVNGSISQATIEWALSRALSDELDIDLFELNDDECGCGNKKAPEKPVCETCESYSKIHLTW